MAKQVEFKDLPEEVLLEIGSYLSPLDVNNCCAVSHAWHHTFSQDPFWKKHCNRDVVAYLKSTPCEANDIKTAIKDHLDVAQMNEWRINYIHQNQLRKNWLHGRYHEKKLDYINVSSYFPVRFTTYEFYDNDFLFIITEKSVKIYNISTSPHVFVREVNYNLPYNFNNITLFFTKISNDKFLVSQNNLVKVFDISTTLEWPVSFTFLLNKTEEESTFATQSPDVRQYMSRSICTQNCMEITTGDFYVGILRTREYLDSCNVQMHIWNIRTKKKLKVETVPIATGEFQSLFSVFMYTSETPSDDIIVECSLRTNIVGNVEFERHYFVYNLKRLLFYPLRVFSTYSLGGEVSPILNNYLYVMKPEGLYVYDYNQPCHVIRHYPYTGRIYMTIAADSVITSSSYEEMKVLKLSSGDIETFNGDWTRMMCNKLWDKFVEFSSVDNFGDISFWYLGKRSEKIFQCKGQFLAHNKFCTRLLLQCNDKILLLSFW